MTALMPLKLFHKRQLRYGPFDFNIMSFLEYNLPGERLVLTESSGAE